MHLLKNERTNKINELREKSGRLLERKAFYPAPPPFPLLHVNTAWKFREVVAHRDRIVAEANMELIVHVNHDGLAAGVNPFTHGLSYYIDMMKTQSLKQVLDIRQVDLILDSTRLRTLGCYPLSGAIDSEATTIADIVAEILQTRSSERQGRLIDSAQSGFMEKKKQEGYFWC